MVTKLLHSDEQVAILEQDAVQALREWLVDHPVRNDDGDVMRWTDGSPVALTVLQVVDRIRQQERFEAARFSYNPFQIPNLTE